MFATSADRGLPRGYVVAITVLFALNPMIVFLRLQRHERGTVVFFLVWSAPAGAVDGRTTTFTTWWPRAESPWRWPIDPV